MWKITQTMDVQGWALTWQSLRRKRYWICRHLSTMMGKKGKSDTQSYWKSYQSKTEKTLCHLQIQGARTFLWLCVNLVTSEAMWENWLTRGGRRKQRPRLWHPFKQRRIDENSSAWNKVGWGVVRLKPRETWIVWRRWRGSDLLHAGERMKQEEGKWPWPQLPLHVRVLPVAHLLHLSQVLYPVSEWC